MRVIIFTVLMTICCSLLIPSFIFQEANAQEEQVLQIVPANKPNEHVFPIFFDDRVITGVNNRIDSFFEIGKNKQSQPGSYIELSFSHSPTLLEGLSFMTVLMDDVPISSIPLDKKTDEQTVMRLDLSHLSLGPGFHKLSFLIQMESTYMVCRNPDSPANWAVIYKSSHVYLNFTDIETHIDLGLYPSPFYEKGSSHPLRTIMVVPDDPHQVELATIAKLSQFFSKQNFVERMPISVYMESDVTDRLLSTHNVIWVGLTDRWKEVGQSVMTEVTEKSIPAGWETGFIGIVPSPWDEQFTHMVIAGDETELTNASLILTDEALFSQLRGSYSLMTAHPIQKHIDSEIQTDQPVEVTFAQMGYDHIIIEGVLEGYSNISYHLPSNWDFSDEATLRLMYSHSTSINLNESVIAVRVNGIPVGSRYLHESVQNKGVIEVELTRDLLAARRSLDIEVNIEFIAAGKKDNNGIDECSDLSFVGHWAVIDSASSLTFTPVERKQFNLQSMPYPFVVEGRWNDTTIVMADSLKQEHLKTIMTLIGILGRDAYDVTELQFARWSEPDLEQRLQSQNVIFVGSAEEIPSAFNDFEHSAIRFSDGSVYSQTENIEILRELQNNSVVIQLARSPFNEQYGLLQIVTTSGGRFDMIVDALINPEENHKIVGKFIVVDNNDVVHHFPYSDPQPVLDRDVVYEETSVSTVQLILFIMVFVLLVSLLFYMIRQSMKN